MTTQERAPSDGQNSPYIPIPMSDTHQWMPLTPLGDPSSAILENVSAGQNDSRRRLLAMSVDSTYQGPAHSTAANKGQKWKPKALEWWSTISLGLVFILLAIASEVGLLHSMKYTGFSIPLTNNNVSRGQQFVKSFVPAIIFFPLFLWFTYSYDALKLVQPYIHMSRNDGASARDSVLVNYVAESALSVFVKSFKKGQWIICVPSIIALLSHVFTSLGGSYFQIIPSSQSSGPHEVNILEYNNLGVNGTGPNRYLPFLTAAGALDEALRTDSSIPSPYVFIDSDNHSWMVPMFNLPDWNNDPWDYVNVTANVSALSVQVNCIAAQSIDVTVPHNTTVYEIVGTLSNNCSVTFYVPQSNTSAWQGAVVLAPFACVESINPKESNRMDPGEYYHPVAFLFFQNSLVKSMAFCYSALEEHSVTAKVAVGSLYSQHILNVTNRAFVRFVEFAPSGLLLDNPSGSPRVAGISDAIALVLSDAIEQYTENRVAAQDQVLSNSTNLASNASYIYMAYQVLVVLSTLVTNSSSYSINGTIEKQAFRIVVNALVSRGLTVMCSLTGLTLIVVFLFHHMWREKIELGAEPSGIAAVAALVSQSEFPKLLTPNDNIKVIEEKLGKLRFKILPDGGVDATKFSTE